jgi:PAS domain S-box-containing protein
MKEQIQHYNSMAEGIFYNSLDAIITVDENGCILKINPAAERLLGFKSSEVSGIILKKILPERSPLKKDQPDSIYRGHYIPVNNKKINTIVIDKNGNKIPVETIIITIKTECSLYYLVTLRNFFEKNNLNNTLSKALSKSEQCNEAKSKFLAVMSHEMRTPLNGILGLHDLLLDTTLNEEQKKYLDLAKYSSDILLSLIDDVLDFSKIEAGKFELEIQLFNPEDIVYQVIEILAPKAFSKGISIQSFININVPVRIESDPIRLRQILLNLVSNAIKFTQNGGGITVNLLYSEDNPDKITFEVIDTGIGIDTKQLDMLFAEFTQADSSTSRKYGGTGLGLAISKRLVELLNGEIGVDSQLDKGSNFWFTLSLGNTKPTSLDTYSVPCNLLSIKVLLVDSNTFSSTVLKRQLEAVKISVFVVTNISNMKTLLNDNNQSNSFDFVIINDMENEIENFCEHYTYSNRNYKFILIGDQKKTERLHTKYPLIFSTYISRPVRRSTLLQRISLLLEKGEDTYQPKPEAKDIIIATNKNIRVLIAEDNKINQVVTEQLLQRAGYQSKIVSDGTEVINEIQQQNYNLILMDLSMPKMDGLEATKQIRKLKKHRKTPIIAMTATALQDEIDLCFEAGMNDYLAKPCRKEELLAMVEKWSTPPDTKADDNLRTSSSINKTTDDDDVNNYLIDNRILDELAHDVTKEMMPDMIDLFISETEKRLQRVVLASQRKDLVNIALESHALKSSAATFGAVHLATKISQLETECLQGNLNNSLALVAQVEDVSKKTMLAIHNSSFMSN